MNGPRVLAGPGFLLCFIIATSAFASSPELAPQCPDDGIDPYPAFGPIDATPAIAVWANLTELPANCFASLDSSAPLTIALAGRFTHEGAIDDIAARLGDVTATIGLPYWSVTDDAWKPLVTSATALNSANAKDTRTNFAAAEVMGHNSLYFAQNDSRSWGLNVYRMRTLEATPDRLVFRTDNVSRIKLGPLTLFSPNTVSATHIITRLEGSTWAYYGLGVIRDSAFKPREKSLVNRQAAFYRYLIGVAPDGQPPLAP